MGKELTPEQLINKENVESGNKCEDLLIAQFWHETFNSSLYKMMSFYAQDIGMINLSNFFKKQAIEENEHSDIVLNILYALNYDVRQVDFKSDLSIPDEHSAESLINLFQDAELATTVALDNILECFKEKNDNFGYQTVNQLFIKQQDELIEVRKMLGLLNSSKDNLTIDQQIKDM